MSRFSRPTFQAPALPAPPAAVATPSTTVTRGRALVDAVPRIASLSIGNFSVNAGLAQARGRLAAQKQAALKRLARSRPVLPPVPAAVSAAPGAVQALQNTTRQLFSATPGADEFGRPR